MNGQGSARRIQKRGMIRLIIISLLLLMVFPSSLIAEARHALVIGNGDYEEMGALKNPVNDATDMAGALANLGFEVQTLIDADVVTMEEAIVRFGQRLSYSVDSVGFFFYAGHGVQSSGINYLIPARAKIASEAFLRSRSVSAQAVLDTMQAAGNRLNIMVLDACRDNPFGWARSGQRGLSIVASQPPGSIIAYATSAGSVAGDGDGRNGIFTGELLKVLAIPEVDVSELFRLTGQAVQERTAGRQIPAIYSQFFDRKTLLPGSGAGIEGAVLAPTVPLGQTPAVTQSSKAELFITTDPFEADITIDGKARGKTPVFLDDVITGTTLVIEARLGTMSTKGTYRVTEGFNELLLILEQERGTLFIQTNENDAELYIDGVRIGLVGSGLIRDVDAGRRMVEIRAPGKEAVHEVEIAKDATSRIVPEFKWFLYTVQFDVSGGNPSGSNSKQLRYKDTYGSLLIPERNGYTFGGWWTSPNKGGSQVLPTTMYTLLQDQKLYASWSPNTYTVYFDSRGGSDLSTSSISVVYGQMYGTLPIPTRDGCVFNGWWTRPNATGKQIQAQSIVDTAANQTLYAWWEVLYGVGDIGPAGGYIFYDKGTHSDGWRYLEAAPAGWSGSMKDPKYMFGYYRPNNSNATVVGTSTDIGSGKTNTVALVTAMGSQTYSTKSSSSIASYAAKVVSDYSRIMDGVTYNDWFLPSKKELNLMYHNLYKKNLGGFSSGGYWSSSEGMGNETWYQDFRQGNVYYVTNNNESMVRPIRAF